MGSPTNKGMTDEQKAKMLEELKRNGIDPKTFAIAFSEMTQSHVRANGQTMQLSQERMEGLQEKQEQLLEDRACLMEAAKKRAGQQTLIPTAGHASPAKVMLNKQEQEALKALDAKLKETNEAIAREQQYQKEAADKRNELVRDMEQYRQHGGKDMITKNGNSELERVAKRILILNGFVHGEQDYKGADMADIAKALASAPKAKGKPTQGHAH